ncbi:S66 family peptidase [Eubacterium oxidoreducens]|uniref:Muramoyltetrapeptide carboxypeptidase LdcA (Peptidoglycan recycling) n=1 Tax=Eubacterium oxidoreducens TaxID=1732 RepID=A0A1G6C411_EUBOX|nr:S66 peptidase family protein [Eubacterium oxidoreducens]SDB27622.1 Muramoyltetrapeptide carboxypeptidase LdcA (peptidoglycan recycling) [Eubacterium oxidoreducens]
MRYPKFLEEHGTIGFVAPAFGCNIEPYKSGFEHSIEKWKEMGHSVWLGPNVYEGSGIGISNTPKACADELMMAFCDDQSDVLISCGGGELMCEILSHMDFERIKNAEPKWYMGYSDNTNFTFLLTTLCNVASIYGPCAATFGMEPWHRALYDAYGVLRGTNLTVHGYDKWEMESLKSEDNPLAPYNCTNDKHLIYGQKEDRVHMEGRMIGGCLDCLSNLVGTGYDQVKLFNSLYGEDGIIWFLECCDLNVMSIRRALWQLDEAGWFRGASGFIIGRPMLYDQPMFGLDQYEAVKGILGKYNVPIVMDCDFGHLPPSMPLICGSYAVIDAIGDEITVDMKII